MTPIPITNEEHLQVIILRSEIDIALARANWWISAANNGSSEMRDVRRGPGDGVPLSPAELRHQAMETAGRHITRAQDINEELKELLDRIKERG